MTANYRTDGKFRIDEERRLLDNRRLPAYTSNMGTEHHFKFTTFTSVAL
jgi:hypothetical protein